jgi:arsenate reductase
MAEAFLNNLCPNKYQAQSAGITPTQINPHVKKAMQEINIDLTNHRSKSINEFQNQTFNIVVTVCDLTKETCPFFPGEKELHKTFPDPSTFTGTEEEIMTKVRQVRDEIKTWIDNTFCKNHTETNETTNNPLKELQKLT